MNIEFRKSTEFNIAIKYSGDINMKIPGYNFTFPLLDGQILVNVLMLNQKNIKRSDTKGRVYEYSFDGDDDKGLLTISRKSGNTNAIQESYIANKKVLMIKIQEYFNIHWEEYTDKNYQTSIKRNEEYRNKVPQYIKQISTTKPKKESNTDKKTEEKLLNQSDEKTIYIPENLEGEKKFQWLERVKQENPKVNFDNIEVKTLLDNQWESIKY